MSLDRADAFCSLYRVLEPQIVPGKVLYLE